MFTELIWKICTDYLILSWVLTFIFAIKEAELDRFQDKKRFLQDYYRAMNVKFTMDDTKKFPLESHWSDWIVEIFWKASLGKVDYHVAL